MAHKIQMYNLLLTDLPVVDVQKLVSQEKVSNAIVTSQALMRVHISGSCVFTIACVPARVGSFHPMYSLVVSAFAPGSDEFKNIEGSVKVEV